MPIIAQHPDTGATLTASLAGNSLVISPRYGESYSFDQAGRLLGLFTNERSYQRALDHRLVERQRGPDLPRRRELDPAERDALLAQTFDTLRQLAHDLPRLGLSAQDARLLAEALNRVLAFGPDRLAADGAQYAALYKPVSILPPDQYLALVLQATEGCSWNRCTFCGLYRDRAFRIKSLDEFRAHCAAVRDFFGEGITLRRGIFLADANALIIPQARLEGLMEIAQQYFALPDGPRPVFSFVSAFDVERKSADEWRRLAALGLQRAYIGLETGDDTLLTFLNKLGKVDDVIAAVHALRAGGIAVGVIVMAGIGGDRYAADHVAHSIEAVRRMALGPRDQVYISKYVPAPGTEYDYQAAVAKIRPLTASEMEAQAQQLRAGLREAAPETVVAPYRVDGFVL